MASDSPILVVDDDPVSRQFLEDILDHGGFQSIAVDTGAAALAWLEHHVPLAVLLDLVPDPNGYEVLDYLRAERRLADVPVLVLTELDSDDEIERVFAAGAEDYVHKPFRAAELMARIRGQLRMRGYVERLGKREHDQQAVLELTQTLASSLDIRDILFTVVQRVAEVAQVDRCSLVLVGESPRTGYVVATSDDEGVRDLPLDLNKYPEICRVLETGSTLVIRDASRHPLLEVVRQSEAPLEFISVALVPILHDHGALGVIFLRSRRAAAFADHEMSLVHTVANATAIALRNARILQSLKDETQQSTFARVEAERRVQLFQRYADFFESAADGMVVIDRSGRLLFTNPRAREITGHTESSLMRMHFTALLTRNEQARAQRLLGGFRDGVYPRGVDLELEPAEGPPIIVNVSFSSVLHEDNAILFTFRDVTVERETAKELKQIKEFLERVIDSSVDGIVSADLRGKVVVFNRAASRIFGYPPGEVIGKLRVDKLYPEGVAREIMQQIKNPDVGGYGRLEDYRVDMLSSNGDKVPVTLSAALVVDNGRPIATVGVFTDIRDKLQMAARLAHAQEELRSREKQALVAELAGAAAHELNQPLTSVIAYAEMLRRQLKENETLQHHAEVIVSEGERMAEIVRKVGKITKYETKSYVGGAKILDLEKASDAEASAKSSRR
ncbi:MAG TPA: PAS domain S-box protein [Polyangiaceae bacterium]